MIVIHANEGRRRWAVTTKTGATVENHQLAHCKQKRCGPDTRKSNIFHMKCGWESETALNMGRAVHCVRYGEGAGYVEERTKCASAGEIKTAGDVIRSRM